MKLAKISSILACVTLVSTGAHAMSKPPAPATQPQASGYTGDVNSLAQQCFAVQSPQNGNYMTRFNQGGAVDNGLSYHFENISKDSATKFFLKPTSFGKFLLTDVDGRYFASHLPAEISAGQYAGEFAEWTLNKEGNDLYSLHATALNMKVRHKTTEGGMYFFDLLNPFNFNSENSFKLIPQSGCTPFPEVTTNVVGNKDLLKGDINAPVRGFVDPHTHITSYEFMGGKMMAGKPFHRWGVEEALKDSKDIHGPNGALDLIGNLYTFEDPNMRYDTRGWPDFPWWPNHQQMSHSGYYYKWIERAYLSGLRLMVTDLVENEVLCNIQKTVNPASWINPNSCNTMDSIRLQAKRLNEMQAYIDAQSGGPGKGFFQLVSSPEQARTVIANGQMAVLMGVEASETFNCGLKDACTIDTVEAQLNELYDLGIRTIYPSHKFDNKLAGSAVEDGLINLGQWLASGRFFETEECDAHTHGGNFKSGFPLIGEVPVLKQILDAANLNPAYDESIEHCNQHGITDLGVYLVNRMIDKNMLIELDHMSNYTATATMDIVEARDYSGVITSHSWMSDGKNGQVHNNVKRLIEAGGFSTPYNVNASGITNRISRYLDIVEQTPYLNGVGFGTDMSGLGGQAGPRDDSNINPLDYPYTSEFGLEFNQQVSGNRVFDLNKDGIAHYGLVADHLQDIREQAPQRIYESVMNSAEAYLQMWERAEASTNSTHFNPLAE
jgi:microsomal dipeptidase-like Zn-dependent dipeptidase